MCSVLFASRQKEVSLAEDGGCSNEGHGHFLQAMLCRLCVVLVSSTKGGGGVDVNNICFYLFDMLLFS